MLGKIAGQLVIIMLVVFMTSAGIAGGMDSSTATSLEAIQVINLSQLVLSFSNSVDRIAAERREAYWISTLGEPAKAVVSDDGLSVTLTTVDQMKPGKEYTLTVQGIRHIEKQSMDFRMVEAIDFLSLQEKILTRNPTIMMNENTLIVLNSGYLGLTEARMALVDAYVQLDSQIRNLPALELPYTDPPADSAQERINQAVEEAYLQVKGALESNRTAIFEQMVNVDYQRADMMINTEKFRTQSAMIARQLTWAAENLIFAYQAISAQLEGLQGTVELLNRQLQIAKVQASFNMIGPVEVREIELSLLELENGKALLTEQQKNMKRELNLLLGQSHDLPIIMEPLTIDVSYLMDDVNWDSDRQKAVQHNFSILVLEQEVHSKYQAIGRYTDDHRVTAAQKEWENAKIRVTDERRRIQLAFDRQYEDLVAKQRTLLIEQEKTGMQEQRHGHAVLRHSLGMVSDLQFLTDSLTLSAQHRKLEEMKTEIFKAHRKYYWMVSGLSL